MPSSPRTPRHRRTSSIKDFPAFSNSPQVNVCSPTRPYNNSRKSSLQSTDPPLTPRPKSSQGGSFDFGFPEDSNGVTAAGNGLGSLADELAEAWDEDDEDGDSIPEISSANIRDSANGHSNQKGGNIASDPTQESSRSIPPVFPLQSWPNGVSSSENPVTRSNGGRKNNELKRPDSDHDPDPGQDSNGIPPSLELQIALIESLSRQDTQGKIKDTSHDEISKDDVTLRVSSLLKDLTPQSTIEDQISRLTTSHNTLSTHLNTQTRLLQTSTSSLLSPFSAPPPMTEVDTLLEHISSLLPQQPPLPSPPPSSSPPLSPTSIPTNQPDSSPPILPQQSPFQPSSLLPFPSPHPLPRLHSLHTSTLDLLHTLSHLSDTLQITSQTTALASRRLRASQSLVRDLIKEDQDQEQGRRYLERGNWDERLKGRQAAGVCRDVVGGFEGVVEGWRTKVLGGAVSTAGLGVGAG
ncbi:hypothetical protein MMC09_001511 [Bachmanniomyces sp. S44760]|nr:hypothetical protein [Bachmanniomyces sp. S44760]